MKYFDFHPKINYSFINKDINIIDIFRKNIINLSESNITHNTLFGNFVFPENIAHQYLEDPNQSWMITSLNNIVTNSDWYYVQATIDLSWNVHLTTLLHIHPYSNGLRGIHQS